MACCSSGVEDGQRTVFLNWAPHSEFSMKILFLSLTIAGMAIINLTICGLL